uniref:Uncharacterized protein n=1 Tax=Rhizophora mucronata TaxID=61149 RepID=A0A2P2R4U0_RHIMU
MRHLFRASSIILLCRSSSRTSTCKP